MVANGHALALCRQQALAPPTSRLMGRAHPPKPCKVQRTIAAGSIHGGASRALIEHLPAPGRVRAGRSRCAVRAVRLRADRPQARVAVARAALHTSESAVRAQLHSLLESIIEVVEALLTVGREPRSGQGEEMSGGRTEWRGPRRGLWPGLVSWVWSPPSLPLHPSGGAPASRSDSSGRCKRTGSDGLARR